MSEFVITAEDVGRLARTRDGRVVHITEFKPWRLYAVTAREVGGKWINDWTVQGGFFPVIGASKLDLVEFVEDEQEITMGPFRINEADVGKLFKTRNGDVRKVIYVHSEPSYTGAVVAIDPETGSALNYQTTGQLLRDSTSDFDLVERYEPMTWAEFCENVIQWATDRGIIANSTPRTQVMKGLTEYGELVEAVLNDDRDEVVDAIGDILVCLVNAATIADRDLSSALRRSVPLTSPAYALAGTAEELGKLLLSIDNSDYDLALCQIQELAKALEVDFKECMETAWESIKDRKGYLNEQGVFVKENEVA